MTVYVNRGRNKNQQVISQEFNIDNGAGTTVDEMVAYFPTAVTIQGVYAVYTEATDSSMGAATLKVGTAAGGVQVVAAYTHLESQAIGTAKTMTLVESKFVGGTKLWVRHTGIAATQVGKYHVIVEYSVDP